MSVEENKAVVRRYFLETHNPPYNLDVIDETCAPAYAQGRWRWMRIERTAFPDARHTIDAVIAAGVLGHVEAGIPATGRSVRVPYGTVYDVRGGKLCALRAYMDTGALYRQLTA